MSSPDPRDLLAHSPMSRLQTVAVAVCVLLIAIDGFDVLAISFAAPGIAAEWGIDRAALGVVLSMELIGMAAGSIAFGRFADRMGRRPSIELCLLVMTAGMLLASTAGGVTILSVYRFVTGLGIGGMLASANAMVAEFANARRRNLAVALMAGGYPMGVILGGSVASLLLETWDWRSVFLFGGMVTLAALPLVRMLLPESIDFLLHQRPPSALARINDTLARMGHEPVRALPHIGGPPAPGGLAGLFAPQLAPTTMVLTAAYLAHIMTFYFLMKWIPKIVVDLGYTASAAGRVLVYANLGGVCGAVLLSLLTQRYDVRRLVIAALLLSVVAVVVFGRGHSGLAQLSIIAAAAGFFTNSAIVGMYAIFAQAFPTGLRASGTGFVIGFGRSGAALGPILAGLLFAAGYALDTVALGMAGGSLLAAAALRLSRMARANGGHAAGSGTASE